MKRLALLSVLFFMGSVPARADFIDHLATVSDVGKMKGPHLGRAKVLVIPMVVDDQPFEAAQGNLAGFEAEIHSFFGPRTGGFTFADYFNRASLGRYQPEPVIASTVHFPSCPQLGPYANCMIPRNPVAGGFSLDAIALLQDVLRFIDEIVTCTQQGPGGTRRCTSGGGINMADVDINGVNGVADGWVDGVILITNAGFNGITLPVKWLAANPLLSITFPPLPSFQYGGTTSVGQVGIAGGETAPWRGTYVSLHEFGHVLGLADLYNESGSTTDMPYSFIADWRYDNAAPLPDPFSRLAFGWADLTQVTGTATLHIKPSIDRGAIYKLGTGNEFFLLEYRTQAPHIEEDLTVPGGVVVQRVRLQKLPSPNEGAFLGTLANCVNCNAWDPMLLVEQADGRYDLQSGLSRNDTDDLFLEGDLISPSTDTAARSANHVVFSTNRLDGTSTDITVQVRSITPQEAVVDVFVPAVADGCAALDWLCRGLTCAANRCGAVADPPDAGVPDAAVAADAAMPPDAAVAVDAAVARDAASPPDASLAPDAAAAPDAATVGDAGSTEAPDASAGGSGGDTDSPSGSQCGCHAASASPPGWTLLLFALVMRRFRR